VSAAVSLADVLPAEALAEAPKDGALAPLTARAEAVVRPQSTEEVADTLRWASAEGVGVLTVGSGVRTRRSALEGRFVVLSTERLSGFEIYEPADVTLTAKAGTPLAEVNKALGAHKQWLPFDPPHVTDRTLGGLVASGESGAVATLYGELRNHVLGATLVCGDGRVIRLGGRVVKNVAGFDLLRPVVGSRGRLGVITSVCLRAFPIPAVDRALVLRSPEIVALADVARAVRTAPILPASSYLWSPAQGGGAALVVRLHGAKSTVDADQATLERRAGVSFERIDDAAPFLEAARDHATQGALTLLLSVLPSRLFDGIAAAGRRLGDVSVAGDAYAGWARVSTNGIDTSGLTALRDDVEALGGTLSVVSSDARAELRALGSRSSQEERDLAARLEQLFDPNGALWPCRA
jgi:glycolate oxidase FAD binding subunit